MAVQKVKLDDSFVYIDDEVDEKERGVLITDKDELDKTIILNPVNEKDMFEDTLVDIFGGNNE
jgi:hypothetical protein